MIIQNLRVVWILTAANSLVFAGSFAQAQSDTGTTTTPVSDTAISHDEPEQQQEVTRVEVVRFALPALVGCNSSPLLKLKIETTGNLNPISLTTIEASLDGTLSATEVSGLMICQGDVNGSFAKDRKCCDTHVRPSTSKADNTGFILSCSPGTCKLAEGVNFVWVAGKLSEKADIDLLTGMTCKQITFSNGRKIEPAQVSTLQRLGVALRKGGDDGVHTYRIPGLARTNSGTLIGVYDIRRRSGRDLPGDLDVGLSRSTDGGRTWEPMRVIMDMGDDPQWQYDGIGDPAILVDRNTGTIWVAATWSHGNRSWKGSGPGLTPEETGQLMLVSSADDGVTWSEPVNITSQLKRTEWCFLLQGPGNGITMRDGTLVFAAQYQDTPEAKRLPRSTIIYSKDHGRTWQIGTGACDSTTEAQVVETEPGVLMLNCRYDLKPARVVMTTRDMGTTWQTHATSETTLIEPVSCMASLIDVDRETGKDFGGWLLFSNPDSTTIRQRMMIKGSTDHGLTWPKEYQLLLDEGDSSGYSCLTMIDDETIGILYEGSQAQLTFQRIPLRDVIKGN
ncbi:MAG: exo-alpha-sialidase [Planctomycetaceae bacterium]